MTEAVSSPGCQGPAVLSDGDVLALLDSLGVAGTHDPEADQEAVAAAGWQALQAGEPAADASAAFVAEHLPAGPGLAATLAQDTPGDAGDWDLPGAAAGYRRLAAWAQARELAAVAEIASRRAAANPRIGAGPDGRPCQLPPEAAAEVALELRMTQYGASAWTDLAIQLRWRLPATGAALAAGTIDLARARIIAEATAVLSDEHAAAVEQRVLPAAGQQTTGQLRQSVRRAVLAVDPGGAEQRRKDTERQAKISLYPGEEGTATLTGSCLPGVQAAAAMARLTAMARALKASGAHGGLDLLRAHIFLGLLLGTMPLIPPPPGSPPDNPPPDDGNGPSGPPDDYPVPGDGQSGDPVPDDGRSGGPDDDPAPADGQSGGPVPDDGTPDNQSPFPDDGRSGDAVADDGRGDQSRFPGDGTPGDQSRFPGDGTPGDQSRFPDDGRSGDAVPDDGRGDRPDDANAPGGYAGHGRPGSAPAGTGPADIAAGCGQDLLAGEDLPGWWPDIPCPGDADAPPDTGDPPEPPEPPPGLQPADTDDDDWPQLPPPDWPALPARLPAAGDLPGTQDGAGLARAGLLDILIPWSSLTGHTREPGQLGRIGPVSPGQARQLLLLAADSPATRWRVIITSDDGRATAVEHARPPCQTRQTGPPATAVTGRVTITIRASTLGTPQADAGACPPALRQVAAAILRAASRAAARARAEAELDTEAGGCAHATATSAYRPPPRLREYIAARDKTCRYDTCGQPAWRTDLDHTIPWHNGGLTCRCNLGGFCRTHHLIKHLPGWQVQQPSPGTFRWTTPAARSYLVKPDPYPT